MSIRLLYLLLLIDVFVGVPHTSKKLDQIKNLRKTQEKSDDIVIIHLNDVHCGLQDSVGYDGFALYKDELKEKYNNVICVDVGDHVQGGAMGAISDGEAIIKIMNKIGFDVVTLGNHEFDYGLEQLNKLGEEISSKYICSNFCYKKNKTSIYEPYRVIEAGGKKFGFIGVVTPLTFSITYLSTLQESDGSATYDFLTTNDTELQQTVQTHINKLRSDEKVDYVILLTHIGMDVEQYTSNGLLSNLEGVDAVLDGHTHLVYNTTSKDKSNTDIHISQTGTKLQSIGKLIFKTDGTILSETISNVPEPSNKEGALSVTRSNANRWVKNETYNFIQEVKDEYAEELNTVVGKSDYELIIKPEGSSDSRSIYCRYRECTLGNLICDAVRDAGQADLTIINGGGVRNNMKAGNITKGDVIETIPWFNNIMIKKVKGQTILDALEFGVRNCPTPSASFPQVSSGVSFDLDTSINSTVQTDSNGQYVNITGARRVSNVKINGENLDLNKIYNISLFEFVSNGGDGYKMFTEYDVDREALMTDTDAVALYIQNNLNGIIPKEYSELQGRINIVNSTSDTNTATTTITTSSPTTTSDNSNDSNISPYYYRKSNKGLSTGAIIAILVPCIVAVIAAIILALVCKSSTSAAAIPQNSSFNNLVIPNKQI